jgi:hypothetical protein
MGHLYLYLPAHKFPATQIFSTNKVMSIQELKRLHTQNQCTRYQFLQSNLCVLIKNIAKYLYDKI